MPHACTSRSNPGKSCRPSKGTAPVTRLVPLPFLVLLALPAAAAEPQLVQVTLSTGGVGQFAFAAQVDGRATLPLDVPLDQVDDLLKSLQIDDPAGSPATVRLPGRQPLAESFRTLPFGPGAFASPEALLAALVGEAARVPGSGAAGTILSVTPLDIALPNGGGTLTRHRIALATAAGIDTLVLEEVPGLELASDTLRRQIGAGLQAIAAQRVQDRRTLQVGLGDGGARTVRFGYVVPAPVWKASYRLTVPAGAGTARLQGFAVVENLSGRDWRDVQVVLTSGQPVLYHTPLYEAVYTARPEAPVEVANRLVPPVDAGALASPAPPPEDAPPPVTPPVPMPARSMAMQAAPAGPQATAPPPAEVQQSVAQVRFRLASPVTAASGESLLLPILDRAFPARRVALFRPDVDPVHPLVALLLTNDGPGALPPGLVTLYEARSDGVAKAGDAKDTNADAGDAQGGPAYIGDARLPAIQPGEDRLASFATDLPVRVEMTQGEDTAITAARAARGVMELTRRVRATTTYRIATPADAGRTLLIEQPKRDGWTLAEPQAAAATPTHYRITRDVPPGTTATVTVVLERPRTERIALTGAGTAQLVALAGQDGFPAPLRAALARAAALRTELDRRTAAAADVRVRQAAIVADQDRLRRNLGAVPSGSALQGQYLAALQKQEATLTDLAAKGETAQRAADEADAALKDYLGALTL